ncbi:MAG TPA: asparaginase [Mycobacteriales bacterium]
MRARPRVAVLSLGGTIAMVETGRGGGLRPELEAADLVGAVPGIAEVAEVTARSVTTLPGASLTFEDIVRTHDTALECVAAGAEGVVVTQGTDTLEETAFLLDLWWPAHVPLVVTGAMRGAGQPGADGPANLLDAVLLAAHAPAAQHGVLVTLAGQVHAARHVRKVHSSHLGAFQSPNLGPVGVVAEGQVTFYADLPAHDVVPRPVPGRSPRVAVVESVLDDDGGPLGLVCDAGYDAVVLSACGVGHVSRAVAERVSEAVRRVPVVFASRTEGGGTRSHTYGFVGSESDLIARGAVPAGVLDHRKARLLLWALLAAGRSREQIATQFRDRAVG